MSEFRIADMMPQVEVLDAMHQQLLDADIDCEPGNNWLKVTGPDVIVEITQRPRYCDRGKWLVQPQARQTDAHFTLDAHDGFPRYYFTDEALVMELKAWLRARGQLPST